MPTFSLVTKLTAISLICLNNQVQSRNFTELMDGIVELKAKIERTNPEMLRGMNRLWDYQMRTTLDKINEMGCWCYFGDDHGKGKVWRGRGILISFIRTNFS